MSIGFLSTFYNKKVIYLFIFFIIIGLVVFSYQSGFNKKAYEGFDAPGNNEATDDLKIETDDLKIRHTVSLPRINENPVYFDIENGNIYIADRGYLKVIPRDYKKEKPLIKYDIDNKKIIQSNISSKTFSNETNTWVYNDNTDYLLYMANDKKTSIIISKQNNNLKQIFFNFSENVKPVDLSDRALIKYRPIQVGAESENEIDFVGVFQDKYFRKIKKIKTLEPRTNSGSVIWPDDTETAQDDIVKRIHALTNMQYKSHYIGERVFVQIEYEYTKDTDDYHYLRGKITKDNNDGTYDVEFYKSILEARSKENNTNIPNEYIYTEIL